MTKRESTSEKIRWIVDHRYDGKYSRLANDIGVSAATIKQLLDSITEPSHKVTRGILLKHRDLSPDWFICDIGLPLREHAEDLDLMRIKLQAYEQGAKNIEKLLKGLKT